MKKFLPLILFVLVFSAVLAGQVVLNKVSTQKAVSKEALVNEAAEKVFLKTKVKTIDGKTIELYKINTPIVVLNFWASWCVPCLSEMPSLMKFKSQFKSNEVTVVAMNTDEEDQMLNIRKTMKKINLKDEFVITLDENTKVATELNITAIPVTIVFHNGKVIERSDGPMDFMSEEFLGKIRSVLKK